MARRSKKRWIKSAIRHKGALHRLLKIRVGHKISMKRMRRAERKWKRKLRRAKTKRQHTAAVRHLRQIALGMRLHRMHGRKH